MSNCCNIFESFEIDKYLIKEYQHWLILFRNRTKTLGNCLIISKRHFEKFSEISETETFELVKVIQDLESLLTKVFNPDKINYQIAMFKEAHFHLHVFPRYEKEREFQGKKWADQWWSKVVGENLPAIPENETLAICSFLKENIK